MKHKVEEIKLENGASGLFIDVPEAPVMHFNLNFRAGDFKSPKGKWDVAHILEHVMFGANDRFEKARDFHAELQKNGAYVNAFTSSYDITYVGECADFEWDRVLELYITAIEKPHLKEGEFKAELGNVREELSSDLNEHFRQLYIASRQAHGMVSLPDGQRLAQLKDINVEDVRRHYKSTHTTNNLRFVIAGNLNGREDKLKQRLSVIDLPKGKREELPDESPIHIDDVLYIERLGVDNLYFMINFLANEKLNVEEEDALNIMNTMLTSMMSAGIFGETREKGLAYGIHSAHTKGKNMTNWWFGTQLLPENAEAVFDIITKHVKKILFGKAPKKDLEAAKKYTLGHFLRRVQTTGHVASLYSGIYFFDGSVEDLTKIEERINGVTTDKITEIAKRMIREDSWGVSVLASESEDLAKRLDAKVAVLWH